jgi:hypothetical protein
MKDNKEWWGTIKSDKGLKNSKEQWRTLKNNEEQWRTLKNN